ncbi:MAG: HIT domain-containing protein [Aigarchaeota archaeon]|nr:HIT domain-containing protein [Aigarchaeota archaeon]MDW8092922.1 HIT domain-containing protein [Nitrososphaerota archaeon]
MERLWAPWRMEYIKAPKKMGECIFCTKPRDKDDEKNLILMRGKLAFVIMNLYPYNPGHLMVAPYRHVGEFEKMREGELLEVLRYVRRSMNVLKEVMNPHGFNIGVNQGKIAGAGIVDHVHIHVVPRWSGDTNFMPVIFDTKVVVEEINRTYAKLRDQLTSKIKK